MMQIIVLWDDHKNKFVCSYSCGKNYSGYIKLINSM